MNLNIWVTELFISLSRLMNDMVQLQHIYPNTNLLEQSL